jgi:hypothetical protein
VGDAGLRKLNWSLKRLVPVRAIGSRQVVMNMSSSAGGSGVVRSTLTATPTGTLTKTQA